MVSTNEICREKLENWIAWYEEMDTNKDYVYLNEKYDKLAGINVLERSITDLAKPLQQEEESK